MDIVVKVSDKNAIFPVQGFFIEYYVVSYFINPFIYPELTGWEPGIPYGLFSKIEFISPKETGYF